MLNKMETKLVFLDVETTGLDPKSDYPIEIAVCVEGSTTSNEMKEYVQLPNEVTISREIQEMTGITKEIVNDKGKSPVELSRTKLRGLVNPDTDIFIAHNANFDLGFLYYHFGIVPNYFLCTRTVEVLDCPSGAASSSLNPVYSAYFGNKKQTHRALDDVYMLRDVYCKQRELLGSERMTELKNTVVETEKRKLVYIPPYAKRIQK